MPERIAQFIEPEEMLPANGQGAVGIECRSDDDTIKKLLAPLECSTTRIRVLAERAMNKALEGGCQVPIGSYGVISANGKDIYLRGLVGAVDGSELIESEITGPIEQGEDLGNKLAQELLARGADKILQQVYAVNNDENS
jgi:hydroxymethylbilane synthase